MLEKLHFRCRFNEITIAAMDKYDRIQELHQLMKDGILTEQEFAEEKLKVMKSEPDVAAAETTSSKGVPRPAPVQPSIPVQTPSAAVRPQPNYPPQQYQQAPQQTIVFPNAPVAKRHSGVGITGFIFALLTLIPIYTSPFFAFIGLILCIIGVSLNGQTYSKGLAIAGLIISILALIGWIVLIIFVASQGYGLRRYGF
jgi:hypothetical protein